LATIAAAPDGRIRLSELSEKLGLHKNTAFSLLETLGALGYVDQIQSREYMLGHRLFELARLSEADERLRAASVAAPVTVAAAPVAAKDVTGSVAPPATAVAAATSAPAAPPKPEVARLPTVEGWILRDVANGSALIESRRGMYEVYAGDPIPGLGRVDAIRKQDGRWVVVTSKGLIVAR